jgi:3-oxoacyl-[acyl-carrier protein] reductase
MFTIDLEGKRAWVTGASRGIGKATAVALAEAGCDVAVGYHTGEKEAAVVVEAIQALGRRAIAVGGDIAKQEDCDRMHATAAKALGPIEILVNNAGIQQNNMFLLLGAGDWERVLGTNLMGPVNTIRSVAKGMWARKAGCIINVSSVAATRPSRGQSNYVASKGALEALTQALAVELAPRNISVNCVAPGPVDTEIWGDEWDATRREILVRRQLVKRFGKPEEIAAWIVMLASPYGAFMSGETIHLNGGAQRAWDGDKS